jgi:hypothetical protein
VAQRSYEKSETILLRLVGFRPQAPHWKGRVSSFPTRYPEPSESNHEAASHTPARTPTWNPGRRPGPTLFLSTSLGRSRMANRSWCGTPRASPSLNSGGLSVCPSARRRRSSAEAASGRAFLFYLCTTGDSFLFRRGAVVCVLRETIRKGRPRFAPRVSLSYLSYRISLSISRYVWVPGYVPPGCY